MWSGTTHIRGYFPYASTLLNLDATRTYLTDSIWLLVNEDAGYTNMLTISEKCSSSNSNLFLSIIKRDFSGSGNYWMVKNGLNFINKNKNYKMDLTI